MSSSALPLSAPLPCAFPGRLHRLCWIHCSYKFIAEGRNQPEAKVVFQAVWSRWKWENWQGRTGDHIQGTETRSFFFSRSDPLTVTDPRSSRLCASQSCSPRMFWAFSGRELDKRLNPGYRLPKRPSKSKRNRIHALYTWVGLLQLLVTWHLYSVSASLECIYSSAPWAAIQGSIWSFAK